jgi:hypothetical protein
MPEHRKKVSVLYAKARAHDDRAFLELIALDPRYLCSELGLLFISRWQSSVDMIPRRHDNPSRAHLQSISRMLLKPFDARGVRLESVTPGVVSLWYHAARILFSGVRRIAKKQCNGKSAAARVRWADEFRRAIARLPATMTIPDDSREGFLIHIGSVDGHIERHGAREQFSSHAVLGSRPNELAVSFVTLMCGLEARAIYTRMKEERSVWVLWPNSKGAFGVLPAHLPRKLEDYSPVEKLLH